MKLPEILSNFDIPGRLAFAAPFGSGNINDTFLAVFRTSFSELQLVVQRVNRKVFPDPEAVMANMRAVTDHCHRKLEALSGASDRVWQMTRIVKTKDGADFVKDEHGEVWRVATRIASARAFDSVQGPEHAEECGAALGRFHFLVSDLPAGKIVDPLPGFHVTGAYLAAYDGMLDSSERAKAMIADSAEARRLAKFVEAHRPLASLFQDRAASGALSRRMFHGDPKVNNIMIDEYTGKGTAMIDLDTVSPGFAQIDFGDAIRSICNPAGEEALDPAGAELDETLLAAFCRGYMAQAREFMTPADRDVLFDAVRLLPFELGLRFFSDHLAGDVYFKVQRPGQNLDRARVQFHLCESIEAREASLRKLLDSL